MKDFKFDARNIASAFAIMEMSMSLPRQKNLLNAANELISETRESIISGGKSPDEINELLDTLQELTLKKYHIEIRVRQLEQAHKIADDKATQSAEEIIILKEDNRTLKEILKKEES